MSRFRLTTALDWLALALAIAAIAILLTGGATLRLGGGVRITARSADRAALAALAVVALRVALDRRTKPLANAPALGRAIRNRLYDPALDRAALLPSESAWRRLGLAAAGICAVAAVQLWRQIVNLRQVPDLGDPLFSIWRFSWVFHKLQGDPRPLFSPNVFYPHELTLTYSDSMLLPAVTTMPLLMLGVHPVVAYNVMMVLTFIASAIAMYVLAERLTGSAAAAFVSALLFGFHPYRFEHYSHYELQMTYCMPLALLALHKLVETPKVRYAVLAGVFAAGQLYSSMYYAVFFSVFAAIVFAATCWLKKVRLRALVVPALVGAVVALALAWPLAHVYRAAHLGDRDKETVEFYSATVADYVTAHPRSAMWGERIRGHQPERSLFPGAVVLVLAAIALIPPIGATRAAYALALLVLFEISRGFNSPFYPYLYEWFEFIRGLRVPARASIILGIALTLLAGFGVRRLLAGRSAVATRVALAAIVAAIVIDVRPILRLEPVWEEPPPIYGAVAGTDAVLAEFPFGGYHAKYTWHVPFMYFSVWHWQNMVNGYSGHAPDGMAEFEKEMDQFPEGRTVGLLRERGTTHVTVNCELYRHGCGDLIERLDAMPDLRLITAARWHGQPVRLYELRR